MNERSGQKGVRIYAHIVSRHIVAWNRAVEEYCERRASELTTHEYKRRTRSLLMTVGRALAKKGILCPPSRFTDQQARFVANELWAPRTYDRPGHAYTTRVQWTGILNQFLDEFQPPARRSREGRFGGYIMRTADRAVPRIALSHEQVRLLIRAVSRKPLSHQGIVAFELSMGLRRSEVLRLKSDQVLTAPMRFLGKGTRGGKWREVPMSRWVSRLVKELVRERAAMTRSLPGRDPGYLFCRVSKGEIRPLSPTWIDNFCIKPLFDEAGIISPGNLNHALRRTFGRTLWEQGVPIELIAQLMGHEEVYTTMRYLSIDVEDKTRAMRVLDTALANPGKMSGLWRRRARRATNSGGFGLRPKMDDRALFASTRSSE